MSQSQLRVAVVLGTGIIISGACYYAGDRVSRMMSYYHGSNYGMLLSIAYVGSIAGMIFGGAHALLGISASLNDTASFLKLDMTAN